MRSTYTLIVKPAVKPLASRHHSEIQAIGDRAKKRFATLALMDDALIGKPTREQLAQLAFVWATHVLALEGWGWWSVSADGSLNPALVRWDKSYFIVPIDAVIALHAEARPRALTALLERLRTLPKGKPGTLEEVRVTK